MIELHHENCAKALEDFDTPGLVLLTIALHCFGDELLGDPETDTLPMDPVEIWSGLNEKYGVWVTDEGQNRLNAVLLAMQGDLFFQDLEVFRAVASSLVDGDVADSIAGVMDEVGAVDVAWAVTEINLARDVEDEIEFSREINEYLDYVLGDSEEDMTYIQGEVESLYQDLIARLLHIGVTKNELRILDESYSEAVSYLEDVP